MFVESRFVSGGPDHSMQAQEVGHVRISGHVRSMAQHMHCKYDICDISCSAPIAFVQFISTCLSSIFFPEAQESWGSSWQLQNYGKRRDPHVFIHLYCIGVVHEWDMNASWDTNSTTLAIYEQIIFYLFTYYMHLMISVAYKKAIQSQIHSLSCIISSSSKLGLLDTVICIKSHRQIQVLSLKNMQLFVSKQ